MSFFGFKTSLFGFKKEEVNAYIEHTLTDAKEKEKALKEENEELLKRAENLTEQLNSAKEALAELTAKVEYYSGKEAEIEKMSVSIGTMYLVAKQNATEIVAQAKACAKEIADHSEKQLTAADEVTKKLDFLKEELTETSEIFSGAVLAMSGDFEDIKVRLKKELNRLENPQKEIEVMD